ncbi:hypothetical protein HDU93_008759 [Gonapodya sp. JEL0774]|nr:hypothetical protein HDU93_008759 [Gonapodya sp. JEL0774]
MPFKPAESQNERASLDMNTRQDGRSGCGCTHDHDATESEDRGQCHRESSSAASLPTPPASSGVEDCVDAHDDATPEESSAVEPPLNSSNLSRFTHSGSAPPARMRPIAAASLLRLTAAQVIVSLDSAVKELVENSLDAGSTSIQVVFRDHGLGGFSVVDNGRGIAKEDFEALGRKHHTSKIASYQDLGKVETYGFRGEAVNALCALADVTIVTATKEPMGYQLDFSPTSTLRHPPTPAPRPRGTTVSVTNLFRSLPVRQQEFRRNVKREFAKALASVQSFAVVATGVRVSVMNVVNSRNTSLLTTKGHSTLRSNITDVFGAKSAQDLFDFDVPLLIETPLKGHTSSHPHSTSTTVPDAEYSLEPLEDKPLTVRAVGAMSLPTPSAGRSSSDRRQIYINARPCDAPKLSKVIAEEWRAAGGAGAGGGLGSGSGTGGFPQCFLDLRCPTDSYDVNVTPDKRTIFLHREDEVIEALRVALRSLFDLQNTRYAANQVRCIGAKGRMGTVVKMGNQSQMGDGEDDVDEAVDRVWSERNSTNERNTTNLKRKARGGEPRNDERVDTDKEEGSDLTEESGSPFPEGEGHASPVQDSQKRNSENSVHPGEALRRPDCLTFPGDENAIEERMDMNEVKSDGSSDQDNHVDAVSEEEEESGIDVDSDPVPEELTFSGTSLIGGSAPTSRPSAKSITSTLSNFLARAGGRSALPGPPPPIPSTSLPKSSPGKHRNRPRNSFTDSSVSVAVPKRRRLELHSSGAKLDPATATATRWRTPVAMRTHLESVKADVDLPALSSRFMAYRRRRREANAAKGNSTSEGLKVEKSDIGSTATDKAEDLLTRTVAKGDFDRMKVVGQFNMGFILVTLPKVPYRGSVRSRGEKEIDLFIVDQHASDEKFNFETLKTTTPIRTQPLIFPRQLHLTAHDELTLADNLEVFSRNGFGVHVNWDAPPTQRCSVVSLPNVGGVDFSERDFEELLAAVVERNGGQQDLVCPRVNALYASRGTPVSSLSYVKLSLLTPNLDINHSLP